MQLLTRLSTILSTPITVYIPDSARSAAMLGAMSTNNESILDYFVHSGSGPRRGKHPKHGGTRLASSPKLVGCALEYTPDAIEPDPYSPFAHAMGETHSNAARGDKLVDILSQLRPVCQEGSRLATDARDFGNDGLF
ncbi:hypothetical protein BCR44DRAFT_1038843 [Catenaria anguillulae PL171]|uniref:Uncharacterized protein n=1 Tax=Catenaria anguillulae PL171 TaxID=765915 RepID=A0A1Y2H7B6_9FUNG|nr:hypothetical protein BCR44DRAFT_1038843 [Catenaria anguillulae PL171]